MLSAAGISRRGGLASPIRAAGAFAPPAVPWRALGVRAGVVLAGDVAAQTVGFLEKFHRDCVVPMTNGEAPRAGAGVDVVDTGRSVRCETRGGFPEDLLAIEVGAALEAYRGQLMATGQFRDASVCIESDLPSWVELVSRDARYRGNPVSVGLVHYGGTTVWLYAQETLPQHVPGPECDA